MRITIVMITRTFYTNSVSLGYFLNIAHSQMDIHMFRSFFTSNFTCYADCIFWSNFNLSKTCGGISITIVPVLSENSYLFLSRCFIIFPSKTQVVVSPEEIACCTLPTGILDSLGPLKPAKEVPYINKKNRTRLVTIFIVSSL